MGELLVQSRRLIVSVSMFSRLLKVNKADIIRSFLMEINRFKMCMRSNRGVTFSDLFFRW